MKGNVSLIKGEMVLVQLQSNYCFSNNQIFIFPRLHTGIVILSLYSQPWRFVTSLDNYIGSVHHYVIAGSKKGTITM